MSRQDVRDAFAAAIRSAVPGVEVFSTRVVNAGTRPQYFCVFMDGGDIRHDMSGVTRETRTEVFVKYSKLNATDEELDGVMELAHTAIMASTGMGKPLLTRFDYDMDGEAHMSLVFTYSTMF